MKYFICPLCSSPLAENTQGLACEKRHQFDRAKEGYVNLLAVQHKNSREPGDAQQQLQARRVFLSAGYFLPLVNALATVVDENTESLLDIGCGEGYFTRGLRERCKRADIYGIDISKAAVRLAAKAGPSNIDYAVASSYLLPVADCSMDLITRILAPSKGEELFRVLKPQGMLIIVTPGERHLIELRKKIYQTLKPHSNVQIPQGFTLINQVSVDYALNVSEGTYSRSLLQMTPFSWKLTPELSELLTQNGIQDTAHFHISLYKK
jgi:23S rRNA (guanine745-N1)-methyltransferase